MSKNVLILLLALVCSGLTNAQELLQIEAITDQAVYICGEEIWVSGSIATAAKGTAMTKSIEAPKTIQLQLLDRKGLAKAETRLLISNGKFSGYLQIPADLGSDYFFLDAYAQGYASSLEMRSLLVINPKIPIANCSSTPAVPENSNKNASLLNISTDKNTYSKRDKIVLSSESLATDAVISVVAQRYDPLVAYADSVSRSYRIISDHAAVGEKETEGDIIKARVFGTKDGSPKKGIKIFAAILGDQAKVSASVSDAEGRVHFIFPFIYGETQVVFSVEGHSDQPLRVELEEENIVHPPINFPCLQLNESMRAAIEERILSYRTQRGYYGEPGKQFTIHDVDTTDFYGKPDHRYALDDYVRFPDMKEILQEFVPEVRVRNGESETPLVQILDEPYKSYFETKGLVMLDGIPILDTKALLAFNPLLIKSIDVMSRKYYLGDTLFNGILHYKSYKGDLAGFTLPAGDIIYPYKGIQIPAVPVFPDYSAGREQPKPDFKNLLYLSLQKTISAKGKLVVPFYTGDSDGQFRIIVQGTDQAGNKVYGEKIINVE